MMPRRNWFSTLSALGLVVVEQRLLGLRRLDVVDRHRQTALRRVAVADVLDRVERRGDCRLVVVVAEALDDDAHLLLLDQLVDVAEALGVVGGQRLLEQQAAGGRLERVGRAAVDRRAAQRDERVQVRASPRRGARSTSHVWRNTRPVPFASSMISLR